MSMDKSRKIITEHKAKKGNLKKEMGLFKRLSLVIVLVVSMVLISCTSEPTEKQVLIIGSLPRSFDTITYAAQQEGLFEEQSIEVEIVPFRSGTEMYTALAVGELDGIIDDLYMAVLLNKESEAVKLVGWNTMPSMTQVVAAPGSNITSPEDLKGKEIAVSLKTIMDYALERLLMKENIDSEEITKVNIPVMPLRLEAVSQGQVPAAILTPPLSDMVVHIGGSIIIEDTEPFAGPGLIFSTESLNDKSDAIDRFIKAWQEAAKLINAEPEKYHSLLVEVAKAPEAVSETFQVTKFPTLRIPTEAEVNSVVSWLSDKGIINEAIPYSRVVSTKYLK